MSRDPIRALSQFFGGRTCLDFANTVDWRLSDAPQELLPDYATLLRWSESRATLPPAAIARLKALSAKEPAKAEAVLKDARKFRAEICRDATALSSGESVDLTQINRRLAATPGQPRLIKTATGHVHDLPGRQLEEPLWPLLWSWAAVLTSADAGRLGLCQAKGCGWFFVDESPNRSRAWCSSEGCGNRERARRAYEKKRRSA
jgi:predicted RNA-binding Zn ribbon-like protein